MTYYDVEFGKDAAQARRDLPPGPVRAGFDSSLDIIGLDPLGTGQPWNDAGPQTERIFTVGSAGLIVYYVDEAQHRIVVTRLLWAG